MLDLNASSAAVLPVLTLAEEQYEGTLGLKLTISVTGTISFEKRLTLLVCKL